MRSRRGWRSTTCRSGGGATPSHPEDAEPRGPARRGIQPGRERQAEHGAGVDRVDDAVVPDARAGIIGMALTLVLLADRRLERFVIRGAPASALGLRRLPAQEAQHARSLLAPHDRNARVRPHPQKARTISAPTHAVV